MDTLIAHPVADAVAWSLQAGALVGVPALGLMMSGGASRRTGVALLSAAAGAILAAPAMSWLAFGRFPTAELVLRPDGTFPSFPGLYTTIAFAAVGVVAHARPSRAPFALVAALLVAAAPFQLGHWFVRDAIGGALLGAGIGATAGAALVRERGFGSLVWAHLATLATFALMYSLHMFPWPVVEWPMLGKLGHVLAVGSLAFWADRAVDGRTLRLGPVELPIAVLATVLFSAGNEAAQALTPWGSASLSDIGLATIGAFAFRALSDALGNGRPSSPTPVPEPQRA